MSELIKINYDVDRQTTSARTLWEFLDKPYEKFTKWFGQYKQYGFIENQDFRAMCIKFHTAQGNESEATDYEITIEMAKELCMLQKTDKGKQARQYFIDLEKQWNSPEAVMARALTIANKKIDAIQNQNFALVQKLEQQAPLVAFAETAARSKDSILIRELAKICCKNGIETGEKRLYQTLREWGLLIPGTTEPYQRYIDQGLFEVTEGTHENEKGVFLHKVTRVLPKGQQYIMNRLKTNPKRS